jgi:hypothetical protein
MNLVRNLPADLEAVLKKRAEQAGLDIPAYVLQTLRLSDLEQAGDTSNIFRRERTGTQLNARFEYEYEYREAEYEYDSQPEESPKPSRSMHLISRLQYSPILGETGG